MGSLSKMRPKNVIATRGGKKLEIVPKDLVLGDICDLTLDMPLPDLRIIDYTFDMEVDNSSLTRGSEPRKRDLESYNFWNSFRDKQRQNKLTKMQLFERTSKKCNNYKYRAKHKYHRW